MAEDKANKTEKPSAKRLRDARKRGQVAKSQDLVIALSLLGFALVLEPMWQNVTGMLFNYLTISFQHVYQTKVALNTLPQLGIQSIMILIILAGPFMLLAVIIGVIGNLLQTGILFTAQPLKPDFKKINPVTGIKNFYSMTTLVNFGKTLFKFVVVSLIAYGAYREALPKIINLAAVAPQDVFEFVLTFAHDIALKVALFLLFLAVLDYMFQRYSFMKKLRMSKQEVKDEYKQNEGDPKLKAQRRSQYQQMLYNSVAKVKEATVVITNPTHFAIAIKYDSAVGVPVVLAKGADEVAQKMKAEAKKLDIPMIENRPVAQALFKAVEPGEFIPAELFEAVAGIIAIVYKLEGQQAGKI